VGGTFAGLAVSRDGGCTFAFAGGPGAHVVSDLAMRSTGDIVGITSVYSQAGPSGSLYDDHLVLTTDDAKTVAVAGGPIDPTLLLESVEIAESDPARLYVTAVRGEGEKRTGALLVSYDAGMSWVERKLDLAPKETGPFIGGVDPKNAERVYVRTAGPVDAPTRVVVTDDAGKSWKKVFDSQTPILGLVLNTDGARLYAGNREGLFSSPTDAFSFTKGSSAEIQCLGVSGSVLWACSSERNGFFAGSSRGGGKTFDARLHLEDIKGPLECPPESSVAKECTAEWPKLRRELGLPDVDDGAKLKPKDPGGPALRGRATRSGRARTGMGAAVGIALLAFAGYTLLKRLRRR
jgi:hypothetical protein